MAVTATAGALFQQSGRGRLRQVGRGREFAFFGQPWAQAQSEDERDGVGREVGGGSGWRGHRYAYGRLILMYGKKHYNVVKQLSSN